MTSEILPDTGTHSREDDGFALVLCIRNFAHIKFTYGCDVAEAVVEQVHLKASEHIDYGWRAVIPQQGDGRILVRRDFSREIRSFSQNLEHEALLVLLGSTPYVVDGTPILVALSLSSENDRGSTNVPPSNTHLPLPEISRQAMAEAVEAFRALEENRLVVVWQPIRAIEDGDVLYHEGLARVRMAPDKPDFAAHSSFIPSIERLGLSRMLDRSMVLEAIRLLQQSARGRLGCNISAQSAVCDAYWSMTFDLLAVDPSIASRLVIEITESSEAADPEGAREFTQRLRALGCQVAVDDFGFGYSSIARIAALRPDIIKIDRQFLRHARRRIFGNQFFSSLIALSASMAAHVVVEGVEDERDMKFARTAGAQWVQGYYLGRPRVYDPANELPASLLTIHEPDVESSPRSSRRQISKEHFSVDLVEK